MLILSITQPCHEKWEEMTPADRGVFCQSCSKHVIDFSTMADEDIVGYFQKKKGQPVCGRFRNSQLNRPLIEISPLVFSMDIPFWKKFLAAVLICFTSFITGCSGAGHRDYTDLPLPLPTSTTTTQLDPHTVAEEVSNTVDTTVHEQPLTQKKKKRKKKGELEIRDYRILSEVVVISPSILPSELTTYGVTTIECSDVYHKPVLPGINLPVTFPDLKKTKEMKLIIK